MIGYVQCDGKWLIAMNPRLAPSGGTGGSCSRRTHIQTWDGCWTGQDWVPQAALAIKFDSREKGQEYYSKHKAQIDEKC
jgi:hypothetical protein